MFYFQDEIEATCPDLLKLGLLSEVGIDVATLRDQSPCVSFHHKSLQDYSASKHVVQTLEGITEYEGNISEPYIHKYMYS